MTQDGARRSLRLMPSHQVSGGNSDGKEQGEEPQQNAAAAGVTEAVTAAMRSAGSGLPTRSSPDCDTSAKAHEGASGVRSLRGRSVATSFAAPEVLPRQRFPVYGNVVLASPTCCGRALT